MSHCKEEGIELGKGTEGGESDDNEWSETVEWRAEVRSSRRGELHRYDDDDDVQVDVTV